MIIDKLAAGLGGQCLVVVRTLNPLGLCDLYRVNHHVAGNKGTCLTAVERYAAVTGGMTRGGYE